MFKVKQKVKLTMTSLTKSVFLQETTPHIWFEFLTLLLTRRSNVNFRSRFSFEDAFEITRVPDDQLDDFNIVSGLVPLLSLVGEATSPAVSRTIPSQVALFPDRATASMRHRAAWQNLGRNLMKVGSQLLEFLTEWLLDIEEDDDSS